MSRSVYLSPSTQEKNIGAGDYGTEEARMNQVADVVEKILKKHEIIVYRNKPEMTLSQVVTNSNVVRPDVHFAIHSNAGGGRGCEVFCHKLGGEGEKLARAIYVSLSTLTPTPDRGVLEGYNLFGEGKPLYELVNTKAPAALVEIAFHDNKDDAEWIEANIENIGTALAIGLLKYFNIPFHDDSSNLEKEIKLLQKLGIITSSEYWEENAVKGKTVSGEYAAILIQRVAATLMKLV